MIGFDEEGELESLKAQCKKLEDCLINEEDVNLHDINDKIIYKGITYNIMYL